MTAIKATKQHMLSLALNKAILSDGHDYNKKANEKVTYLIKVSN